MLPTCLAFLEVLHDNASVEVPWREASVKCQGPLGCGASEAFGIRYTVWPYGTRVDIHQNHH